jgi:hypothetical protein
MLCLTLLSEEDKQRFGDSWVEYVEKHKQLAIEYIDKLTHKPQSFVEQLLFALGFS